MKLNLSYLLFIMFFVSCSTTSNTIQNTKSQSSNSRTLPETLYYADANQDGNKESISLEDDNKPEPVQGKDQWIRDFYGSIKYPASARERGTSGVVILDVEVNKLGKIIHVNIKKGISPDCDTEAKRAYIYSVQKGYTPLMINNVPMDFRVEVPVGFWLM